MKRNPRNTDWQNQIEQKGYAVINNGQALSANELEGFVRSTFQPYAHNDTDLVGEFIMHIKPDSMRTSNNPSYFTNDRFSLHTDLSYMRIPPKYLIMHCVRASPCGGGKCIISDGIHAYAQISAKHQNELRKVAYRFKYPPGARHGRSDEYAVTTRSENTLHFRFKTQSMIYHKSLASSITNFNNAIEQCTEEIHLSSGDTLIINNLRCLHGRTQFQVNGDESLNRCMMRTYGSDWA